MGAIDCNCCTCEPCCVSRIEIEFGKEDEVSGEDPKVPIGTFAWDVETQPASVVTSKEVAYGLTLPVCSRTYLAPISERICDGTAKALDINGKFITLDRVFPSMSGRYGFLETVDFVGSTGIRCNVFIYGLFVVVQRAPGYSRILMGSYGIEEFFGYVVAGSTVRAYDTGTCLGTGPTSTYGTPPDSLYCTTSATDGTCPGVNAGRLTSYAFRSGPNGMPLPTLDSGWFASESCPVGDFVSGLYAFYEYFGTVPTNDACRLPYTREYFPLGLSPCNWGYVTETRRPLAESYTMRRNKVKLFTC